MEMQIDEAKAFAGEYTVDMLCSGKDFRGLGSLGKYLVMAVAGPADANAKFISQETTRTSELYQAMAKEVTEEFVLGILGLGDVKRSPIEAATHLVDRVWDAYIGWAKAA